jgi:hypothetical protein
MLFDEFKLYGIRFERSLNVEKIDRNLGNVKLKSISDKKHISKVKKKKKLKFELK